jgi:hypothetical protein
MQVLDGHISTHSIKTLVIYSMLWIMLLASYCRVLLLSLLDSLFIFCLTFVQCIIRGDYFVRFDFIVQFSCSPSKCSVLILDCIPGILIPLNIIIKQINKHYIADCTVFVLVKERVAYYYHRRRSDIRNQYSPRPN